MSTVTLPPPSPIHPERPVDVDTVRTSKTPARRRADNVHDPDAQTKKPPSVRLEGESDETVAPGSKPPSVGLEGERIRQSSLHVEADDVKTNNDCVENDHDTQQSPRRPNCVRVWS
ncbi:hypothetical protein PAXINDRAFT_21323 [Paxillus involutus ATCC 200175]|uniref:Uncharacterized protein n=1 Tax=Paxillus involutus ATCC 200175 TaxID=664439 RepID=A0A0C9TB26_PAXIN|nr:hypothetical protein PAXINDRAFT_21323 [Paxillus involutus ATCC 200175]